MNKTRGFTLIELMVVIAIISIIAGVVTPQMRRYIDTAYEVKLYKAYKIFNHYSAMWSAENQGKEVEKFTDFSSWFEIKIDSPQMNELIGATAEYISGTYNKEIYVYSGNRKARFYITQGAIFMDDIIDK